MIAQSVGAFFANERNRDLVDKLRDAGRQPRRAAERPRCRPTTPSLAGLTFVLTGALER